MGERVVGGDDEVECECEGLREYEEKLTEGGR